MKSKFSLSDFMSNMASGLARPYRFEVEIPNPLCVKKFASTTQRVSLYCKAAQLPQSRILTSRNQYFGPPEYRPIGVDYGGDNLTLTFYVDEKMYVKAFFDEWIDGIVNRRTGITEYRDSYTVNMKVRQLMQVEALPDPGKRVGKSFTKNTANFSNRESIAYEANFELAFPVSVNPLTLDHGSIGQVHELSVTFNYRRWNWVVPNSSVEKSANNINWNDPSIPERKIAGVNTPDERPLVDSKLA
jgi:hypothetical protein